MKQHTPTAGQQLAFHAELNHWAEGMDYCAVAVPADITQALGTKGPVLVMARVNDSEPFQVSLFPVGGGQHCIRTRRRFGKQRTPRRATASWCDSRCWTGPLWMFLST